MCLPWAVPCSYSRATGAARGEGHSCSGPARRGSGCSSARCVFPWCPSCAWMRGGDAVRREGRGCVREHDGASGACHPGAVRSPAHAALARLTHHEWPRPTPRSWLSWLAQDPALAPGAEPVEGTFCCASVPLPCCTSAACCEAWEEEGLSESAAPVALKEDGTVRREEGGREGGRQGGRQVTISTNKY